MLKANKIYDNRFVLEDYYRLIRANAERRGWLIFYTHDISENPSPFGCTPREFEKVLDLAAKTNAMILCVRDAVKLFEK